MHFSCITVCSNLIGQASGGAGPKVVSEDSSVKTDPGESHSLLASMATAHALSMSK